MEWGARLFPAAVPARCRRSASPLPAVTGSEPRATTTASRVGRGLPKRGGRAGGEKKNNQELNQKKPLPSAAAGAEPRAAAAPGPSRAPGRLCPPGPGARGSSSGTALTKSPARLYVTPCRKRTPYFVLLMST